MTLKSWIKSVGGPHEASKLLNIERHTVYYWWWKKTKPTGRNALKIIKASKGKMSFESIYS